ncbi:helix-turn-helix domain-containing protein [Streptomyces sp. NPDC090442]|uniref:helix-turn-helix domain-containing protein n=1 Tax=Streptomyces sp. NPDC090442 TaxID=3365962 RepID=UPI0038058641
MHSNDRPSDIIGAQIRRHRTRLGLNRDQLAERCADLGAPELSYSALVDIENGRKTKEGKRRRHVTVDELTVLGLALAVPPLLLALPLGTEGSVPTVPAAGPRDAYTVWKWWTGEETPALAGPLDGRHYPDPHPITEGGPKWSAAWAEAAYPASLYPEFERRREAAHRAHLRAEAEQSKGGSAAAHTEYLHRLEELARHINDMGRAGVPVPALRADLIEDMKGLDVLDAPNTLNPRGNQ